jgi:plasmid stabilization system protein ParE
MIPVVISKAAGRDLQGIFDYIGADNPLRARSFSGELREQRCKQIGEFPKAARAMQLRGREIRLLPFRGYIIIYRIEEAKRVTIERIWHGARNIAALLADHLEED